MIFDPTQINISISGCSTRMVSENVDTENVEGLSGGFDANAHIQDVVFSMGEDEHKIR